MFGGEVARLLGYDRIPEVLPESLGAGDRTNAFRRWPVQESFWVAWLSASLHSDGVSDSENVFRCRRMPCIIHSRARTPVFCVAIWCSSLLGVAGHHLHQAAVRRLHFEVGKVLAIGNRYENKVSGVLIYGPLAHTYKQSKSRKQVVFGLLPTSKAWWKAL